MKNFKPSKFFLIGILLAISFVHTIVHDEFVDSRFAEAQQSLHTQVIQGKAPAPIQYRIMVYYTAEALLRLGLPFNVSYQIIRFVFIFLTGYFFYLFLTTWFTSEISLAGILYFFAILPITYLRYYMQPMDIPNLFFFLLGYLLILKRKDWLLIPLMFVSMLNRETPILLVPVYLFFRWDELKLTQLLLRTSLLAATGLGTYIGLRKIFALKEYYSDLFYLFYNLTNNRTYFFMLCIFGPFIFLAFKKWSIKPKFLKRAALMLPFFLVIHFTMTIMVEPRLWLPIVPIIVALGLYSVVPENFLVPQIKSSSENLKKRHGKLLYLIVLSGFVLFFIGFFYWYQSAHLKDRQLHNKVQQLLTDSKIYLSAGRINEALQQLNKARVYAPQNDEIYYQLGIIYAYYLYDDERALYHFQRCLELNPHHFDEKKIKNQIEWLIYKINKKKENPITTDEHRN